MCWRSQFVTGWAHANPQFWKKKKITEVYILSDSQYFAKLLLCCLSINAVLVWIFALLLLLLSPSLHLLMAFLLYCHFSSSIDLRVKTNTLSLIVSQLNYPAFHSSPTRWIPLSHLFHSLHFAFYFFDGMPFCFPVSLIDWMTTTLGFVCFAIKYFSLQNIFRWK